MSKTKCELKESEVEKLKVWIKMSDDLKNLKEKEAKLRIELCEEFLKGKVPPCKAKQIVENIEIEAVRGVSHKVDESVVTQLFSEFSDEEKNVFKFKPDVKLKEYKKLSKNSIVHEAITVKPAMPTIKIKFLEE